MTNSYLKNKQHKWKKLFEKLDEAHIAGLKQLANEMKTGDMDSKEIRANITLFKNEKLEKNDIKQVGESKLKQRLKQINQKTPKTLK